MKEINFCRFPKAFAFRKWRKPKVSRFPKAFAFRKWRKSKSFLDPLRHLPIENEVILRFFWDSLRHPPLGKWRNSKDFRRFSKAFAFRKWRFFWDFLRTKENRPWDEMISSRDEKNRPPGTKCSSDFVLRDEKNFVLGRGRDEMGFSVTFPFRP